MRERQTVKVAILRTDRAVSMGVFVGEHGLDERAHGFLVPAASALAGASETRFVLKHQPPWLAVVPAFYDFTHAPLKFFSQSPRARGYPWG